MAEENASENRIGIIALAEQVKALVAAHTEVKDILREIVRQMGEIERRAGDACKTCDLRVTVNVIGTRTNVLEKEMAGINGRIAGMSLAAGALAFLGSFFVRR